MATKTKTAYTSQGIVGTVKLGHTEDSILRSMCAGPKKNKTYNRKQQPLKPEVAIKRHEKKKLKRLQKKSSGEA